MCSNFALKSGHVTQQVFSEDCRLRLPVGLAMACKTAVSFLQ